MTGAVSPVVRGRRLAAALRRLRAESGRTVEEVAVHLECSAAKVSRIENGLVGVRIQDARDLLDLYDVQGSRREELLQLVRQARGKGWWSPYADVMTEGFEQVIGFEDEAAVIWKVEARLVPGLLQTEHYATELLTSRQDVPLETVERRLHLRMARQQILGRPDPPMLRLVLDEAALRRQIGPPTVMREQIQRLMRDAQAPNISIRILTFASETHQAVGSSFTIFGFANPGDPRMVYEEAFEGTVLYESADIIGRYMAGFEQAASCALSEVDSLMFLADLHEKRA